MTHAKRNGAAASGLLDDPDIRADALEFAVQATKCGLWAWDLESDALAWSPEAAAILGVETIEPSIEGFLRLVHPGDADKARAAFARALAAGSALHLEFRRRRADGGASRFAAFGRPRYDGAVARCFIGAIAPLPEKGAREDFSRLADDERFANRDLALARLAGLRDDIVACLAGTDDIRRAEVEEDILRFLLCRIVRPEVAERDAAALMARFGSLSTVFQSAPAVVATVEGVDERHQLLFETVRLSIQCVLRPIREEVQFTSEQAIVSYLRVAQSHKMREELRVVFLDRARHIICDEVMQEGTVDQTPVYVREIMKRALELSASSIILAHNHPSGNAMPSFQDILKTQQIVQAAKTLGITVDDHIILTRHGHTSLRAMRMMEGPDGE